jgi:hypothetical protein
MCEPVACCCLTSLFSVIMSMSSLSIMCSPSLCACMSRRRHCALAVANRGASRAVAAGPAQTTGRRGPALVPRVGARSHSSPRCAGGRGELQRCDTGRRVARPIPRGIRQRAALLRRAQVRMRSPVRPLAVDAPVIVVVVAVVVAPVEWRQVLVSMGPSVPRYWFRARAFAACVTCAVCVSGSTFNRRTRCSSKQPVLTGLSQDSTKWRRSPTIPSINFKPTNVSQQR